MTDLTKHNYYKGETVSPENLNASFGYPDRIRDSMVSELLGYGIIQGFAVSQSNNLELKIGPGLAYNTVGERLVLNEEQLVNINNLLPTSGSKTVALGIKPDYSKTDPATDTEGNVVYTTWTPTVEISVDENLPEEFFPLASITLNSQGITGIDPTYNLFSLPLIEDICDPIGTVTAMMRVNPPSAKWKLMNGDRLEKTEFPKLYALFQAEIPSLIVDENTLRLPNLTDTGRFLRQAPPGVSIDVSQACAVQNHVHDTHIGAHSHTFPRGEESGYHGRIKASNNTNHGEWRTNSTDLGTKRSGNPVEGADTETRPFAYTVNYFIKAR